jgi:hypothetical protein
MDNLVPSRRCEGGEVREGCRGDTSLWGMVGSVAMYPSIGLATTSPFYKTLP